MRTKICRTCNKELTIDLYHKPNMGSCKECTNKKQKEDRLKSAQKNKNAADVQYGRMEWKKEYEKPWSPIKSSDMPLEKYLASKKQKRDEDI